MAFLRKPPTTSLVLLLLFATNFLNVTITATVTTTNPSLDIKMDLIRIDAGRNLTFSERLERALHRGKRRIAHSIQRRKEMAAGISPGQSKIESSVQAGDYEFMMNLSIGTPPSPYIAIVDTGSGLIWTQCAPCEKCFQQPAPLFWPANSSSFAKLPCSSPLCYDLGTRTKCTPDCVYLYSYADSSTTEGVLGTETFTFKSSFGNHDVSIHNVAFGCGIKNQGTFIQASGLMALGRGELSLIWQLRPLGYWKFSYCLASIIKQSSPLILGPGADLNIPDVSSAAASILVNPAMPLWPGYFLDLLGISVAGERLPIPSSTFAFKQDGSGGFVLDSGSTISLLEASAYGQVRAALIKALNMTPADSSMTEFDLCFSSSPTKNPPLTLHFDRGDLDLYGYFIDYDKFGLYCFPMLPKSGISLFGNILQENLHILYDLSENVVTFTPALCDQV